MVLLSISLGLAIQAQGSIDAVGYGSSISGWKLDQQYPDGSLILCRGNHWLRLVGTKAMIISGYPTSDGKSSALEYQYHSKSGRWASFDPSSFTIEMGKMHLSGDLLRGRLHGKPSAISSSSNNLDFGISPSCRYLLVSYLDNSKINDYSGESLPTLALLSVNPLKLIRTYAGQRPKWINENEFTFFSVGWDLRKATVSSSRSHKLASNLISPAFISRKVFAMRENGADNMTILNVSDHRIVGQCAVTKHTFENFAYIRNFKSIESVLSKLP